MAKLVEPSGVALHDDIIPWKRFPLQCAFARVIRRSPVDSLCKDSLMELDIYLMLALQAADQTVELPVS